MAKLEKFFRHSPDKNHWFVKYTQLTPFGLEVSYAFIDQRVTPHIKVERTLALLGVPVERIREFLALELIKTRHDYKRILMEEQRKNGLKPRA